MSEKIDINVADAATLTNITGIGPALAERIIEYRETVHPFEEVIELAAVPGISEKMVRGFEALVTVTAVPQDLNEAEEIPLLDTPEEVELLGAPDQPEALLAAELPDDPPEIEEIVVAETAHTDEAEVETASVVEEEEVEEIVAETAAPPTDSSGIEDLHLAEPTTPIRPEPDVFTAATAQPPADGEAKARRRGCLNALVGATFGAILGAVLTLAILAAINNGTINYANSDTQLRQQLNTEIISRTNELNQLSTRVSTVATQEAAANQSLQTDLDTANETLVNNEEQIGNLATRSGDLEQRLQEVSGAAETFTNFLDGLQMLLNDLEEGTTTPTSTPVEVTASPTPTQTPFSTHTPSPSATTAVQPTRTPQPTATPFTFPTNTPAPQP